VSLSSKLYPPDGSDRAQELAPAMSAVRTNCNISDARHAADYTLCVYLLKMREYYRWENGIPFSGDLPNGKVTKWLTEREQLWESLEDKPFENIPLTGNRYDPFDAEAINNILNPLGYVYSSGYGRNMKPHFFLGELEEHQKHHAYTLLISGREHVRDISAPPAMTLHKTIFIRRESLRRMLWEKFEEWRWNKPANAMRAALGCYDFDNEPELALDQMTGNELHSTLLHEIGETEAGRLLGPGWEVLLTAIPHSKAEIMVRAVRDHLADALSTLPGLLESKNSASWHFHMANMANMRKDLFPSMQATYEEWNRSGNFQPLERLTENARTHWLSVAEDILGLFENKQPDLQADLVSLIEGRRL